MDSAHNLAQLRARKAELVKRLGAADYFRPGSLVGRFRKCGKPYCHCAHDGSPGHGPSWSLTRAVDGKTVTRIIPSAAVEQTKEQIAEYQRFKETVDELVETNVLICDTLLEARQESGTADGTPAGGEKGGSKRRSKRRS